MLRKFDNFTLADQRQPEPRCPKCATPLEPDGTCYACQFEDDC